ncbi:MAG: hypothetical protein RR359_03330 [Bacilli bacterium]
MKLVKGDTIILNRDIMDGRLVRGTEFKITSIVNDEEMVMIVNDFVGEGCFSFEEIEKYFDLVSNKCEDYDIKEDKTDKIEDIYMEKKKNKVIKLFDKFRK